MRVHEKIRFIRQQKGWSQEETADKLNMSANGYGSIERGETDVNLSRLEEIAVTFGVNVSEFFDEEVKNAFYLSGTNNTATQNNQILGYCHFATDTPNCDYLRQKMELEKQTFVCEQKEKEITLLREENALLKEINTLLKRRA